MLWPLLSASSDEDVEMVGNAVPEVSFVNGYESPTHPLGIPSLDMTTRYRVQGAPCGSSKGIRLLPRGSLHSGPSERSVLWWILGYTLVTLRTATWTRRELVL